VDWKPKVGEEVIYAAEPLLYGVMVVVRIWGKTGVECRSKFRSAAWPKNLLERFSPEELAPAPAGYAPAGSQPIEAPESD
jgi:hypothetical protein